MIQTFSMVDVNVLYRNKEQASIFNPDTASPPTLSKGILPEARGLAVRGIKQKGDYEMPNDG